MLPRRMKPFFLTVLVLGAVMAAPATARADDPTIDDLISGLAGAALDPCDGTINGYTVDQL